MSWPMTADSFLAHVTTAKRWWVSVFRLTGFSRPKDEMETRKFHNP